MDNNNQNFQSDLELETPKHYDNSIMSVYKFCEIHNLNSYEYDLIKRIVRCRKKGNFIEDLITKRKLTLLIKKLRLLIASRNHRQNLSKVSHL